MFKKNFFSLVYMLMFLLFIFSIIMFLLSMKFSFFQSGMILEWVIFSCSSVSLSLSFIFDFFSFFFSGSVLMISCLVMLFSKNYMMNDLNFKRFIYLVLIFVLSMQLLIFIPHLMFLLLGWDGLGLSSYLLIIYYKNSKSLGAGMLTLSFNRLGDVFLLLSISLMMNFGHWFPFFIFLKNEFLLLTFLIVLGAMTKSAQVPFSSWLPAAMAAPTPVSALVHSSTLVTAGVYILFRFYNFIFYSFEVSNFLLIMSSMTMMLAGMSALNEMDMKKIIALSTLSNLGMMVSSLSLGLPLLSFFHLITHAMFKASLFICAGYYIDFMMHSQDLRFLGDIIKRFPLISSSFMISNLALCGFPFMSGFYSKDLILESMFFFPSSFFSFFFFFIGSFLTTIYSIRLLLSCVTSKFNSFKLMYSSSKLIFSFIPSFILSVGGIIFGSILLYEIENSGCYLNLFFFIKTIPLLGILLGFIIMMIFFFFIFSGLNNFIMSFFSFMFFLVPLNSQFYFSKVNSLGKKSFYLLDQGWSELIGPKVLFSSGFKMLYNIRVFQNNNILMLVSISLFFYFFFLILI